MSTEQKTFAFAGISTLDGVKGFRFSNTPLNLRVNMLRHKGHEDIDLRELPKAMTQVQAIAWVLANVKNSKGAVIVTRAADKTTKSEVVLKGEALAKKQKERAAARAAKKAA